MAPLLRFVTIATLFAAAGTWFQLTAFRKNAAEKDAEPPKTANRDAMPGSKSIERPLPMPTAVGPVNAPPESGSSMRVGDVRDPGDYARLRGDILPVPSATDSLAATTASSDTHPSILPHVQTGEPTITSAVAAGQSPIADNRTLGHPPSTNTTNNSTETQRSTTPEVATLPGFVESQRGTQSR